MPALRSAVGYAIFSVISAVPWAPSANILKLHECARRLAEEGGDWAAKSDFLTPGRR